jgi:hypothetical protein
VKLLAGVVLAVLAGTAHADVVVARGGALYRIDLETKTEVELAKLPAGAKVRGLRGDAKGAVTLVDLMGTWAYLPLDGTTKALRPLPCGDGPAQLAEDAGCVICRGTTTASMIVNLATAKVTPVEAAGARIAGRTLVWTDATGIWSAPLADPKRKTRVAPEPPLRGFLPSPDGSRAVGVYADFVYQGKQKVAAELLMAFALDGEGARRKGIRNAVPIEWSHDGAWILEQDGASACLVRASGGQYKCWKGFTAASVAPDGSYALVLAKGALYRAKLDGPYDTAPELVTKTADAAVWIATGRR